MYLSVQSALQFDSLFEVVPERLFFLAHEVLNPLFCSYIFLMIEKWSPFRYLCEGWLPPNALPRYHSTPMAEKLARNSLFEKSRMERAAPSLGRSLHCTPLSRQGEILANAPAVACSSASTWNSVYRIARLCYRDNGVFYVHACSFSSGDQARRMLITRLYPLSSIRFVSQFCILRCQESLLPRKRLAAMEPQPVSQGHTQWIRCMASALYQQE